jgi:uridylate kinase|tara:strand:+ start:605 stop:1336 length:732 start_codon:yes stop_codon:yes gene_type:complete
MADPRYKRVLLKISGEAFCKEGARGVDISEARSIAGQVCEASQQGSQIAIVVGGGNIVRGGELSQYGINEAQGDYMGMLATVINALALQDVLEQMGKATRVMTAIPVQAVAETFLRRRALRHLEKGRVVILAAGTGNPHFTTDTAAALRATELGAEVLLKASKVDGVYDADPKKNPGATKIEHLRYLDVLNQGLGVMDMTAVTLCMEKNLPIIVFDLWKNGSITRAVRGERIGTLIDGSSANK